MSDCTCLSACPFFLGKMANMPSMSEMLKQRYCHGDWEKCARYRVFAEFGRENVPSDLFPNENERADQVLVELRA